MTNHSGALVLVSLSLMFGGCQASTFTPAADTGATTATFAASAGAAIASPVATATRTQAPTPIPTLPHTSAQMSSAPKGAISVKLAATDSMPQFQPKEITAKAGTVAFFLENVPNAFLSPEHNMQIGPTIGEVLAGTPRIRALETLTFTVNDLTPGTYVYWCSIKGFEGKTHAEYGMVGTLTITP